MAKNIQERTIIVGNKDGAFTTIFNRFRSSPKEEKSDIALLRSMLANEKLRLLHVLKTKQPNSIYELAKILGRDFKSVRQDTALLEKMGFIETIPIHKGKREKLKPLLVVDVLKLRIEI